MGPTLTIDHCLSESQVLHAWFLSIEASQFFIIMVHLNSYIYFLWIPQYIDGRYLLPLGKTSPEICKMVCTSKSSAFQKNSKRTQWFSCSWPQPDMKFRIDMTTKTLYIMEIKWAQYSDGIVLSNKIGYIVVQQALHLFKSSNEDLLTTFQLFSWCWYLNQDLLLSLSSFSRPW